MRGSTREQVEARIATSPGRVWSWSDFADLADREVVDNVVSRKARQDQAALEAANERRDWMEFLSKPRVLRVDRGLYYSPALNPLTKRPTSPSPASVIDAVMKREGARYLVPQAVAANRLGLTPLVQTSIEVETDARLRPIRVGKGRITFVTRSPARLQWAGRPAATVVQGLAWARDLIVGDGNEDSKASMRAKLGAYLAEEEIRADLRAGVHAVPGWMRVEIDEAAKAAGLGAVFVRAPDEEPDMAQGYAP